MYFIRFLRSCFRGLLRFVFHTWTTLFRRLRSKLLLPYTDRMNMESDEECQYDSTWEDENQKETSRKHKSYRSRRNLSAARDMQAFRHRCLKVREDEGVDGDGGYPGKTDHPNLDFYKGRIKSTPDGAYIDDFHKRWWGDYDRLEDVHSYIQWLFPLQEPGMNWSAKELSKTEIKLFRKDEKLKSKLVESYKMMLDFYGIQLVSESTGAVERADNWKERFLNLNRYSHNNLRITRILKCLGTLGLEHYQAPLVQFFLNETLRKSQLPRVKQSVLDYFMFAVLDRSERRELVRFAYEHFRPREDFVWGPKKILSKMLSDSECVGEQNQESVGNDNDNKNPNNSDSDDGRNSPMEVQTTDDNQSNISNEATPKYNESNQVMIKDGSSCEMMVQNQESVGHNNDNDCGDGSNSPRVEDRNHRNGNVDQAADNSSNISNELTPNTIQSDQVTNEDNPSSDVTVQNQDSVGSVNDINLNISESGNGNSHREEDMKEQDKKHTNGNVDQTADNNQINISNELTPNRIQSDQDDGSSKMMTTYI